MDNSVKKDPTQDPVLSATPTDTTPPPVDPAVTPPSDTTLSATPSVTAPTDASFPTDSPAPSPSDVPTPSSEPAASPMTDTSAIGADTTLPETPASDGMRTVLADAPTSETPALDVTPPASLDTTAMTTPEPTPVVADATPTPIEPEPADDSMAATIAVAPAQPDADTMPSGAATSGAVAVSSGGSKKGMILALITVVLLAGLAIGAYFMFMSSTAIPELSQQKKVDVTAQISPTLPPVDEQAMTAAKDTSDEQLSKDAANVDASMGSLDTSVSSVDAGLADKPVSLN